MFECDQRQRALSCAPRAFYGLALALGIAAGGAQGQEVRLQAAEARAALDAASLLRALPDDAVPQDYVAAARADYRRLLTALYAEGFYSGTVSILVDGVEAAAIAPLDAPDRIDEVVIRVDPGPRFSFGEVALAPLPAGATVAAELGPRAAARSGSIQTAVRGVVEAWRDLGYAKVAVAEQRIIARHADEKLDVEVTFDRGPRLRFGRLSVSGDLTVPDDRIRQIAGLPVGEVFSPAAITRAERRLRRTGTFGSVALSESAEIGPDDTLPITAQLSEARPRRIGAGVAFSSVEGLTLSGFWLHRNFLGGAERFRADAEIAGISGETGGADYRLGGNFSRPATFGPDTDYFLDGEISREDEPEFLIDKIALETGFSRILTDELTVRAGVGLRYAREETEIGTREYTLLTLPLDATLDRRDNATNARDGYYVDLSATPFVSPDGDIAGSRLFADMRGYLTLGDAARLTFAGRGQMGSVIGATVTEAPADFLFYSGGGGTVRGQPYQALGVETTQGMTTVTTGGTSFLGAQLEARYLIREKISLVGFYDIGHVGETATPTESGDWHAGTGLGLRYDTAVGPIRFDIGTPASGDDAFGAVQFYIGIGQAF